MYIFLFFLVNQQLFTLYTLLKKNVIETLSKCNNFINYRLKIKKNTIHNITKNNEQHRKNIKSIHMY